MNRPPASPRAVTATVCAAALVSLAHPGVVWGCGPTPQKVVREITIPAEPAKVWGAVRDVADFSRWHPGINGSSLVRALDADGQEVTYYILELKAGGKLKEKLRTVADAEMRLDSSMEEGELPVSNFRNVLQVRATPNPGESVVTWTGRFGNKANAMDAPPGQDNAAAIAAVSAFFDEGLAGLKHRMTMF